MLYEQAANVLGEIRKRVGNMAVYASATPSYYNPRLCKSTTPEGPARTQKVVARLVSEGKVLQGPVFPTLESNHLADRCHPNAEGQRIEGEILKEWF